MVNTNAFGLIAIKVIIGLFILCMIYIVLTPSKEPSVVYSNPTLDGQTEVRFTSEMYTCHMTYKRCGLTVSDSSSGQTLYKIVGREEK